MAKKVTPVLRSIKHGRADKPKEGCIAVLYSALTWPHLSTVCRSGLLNTKGIKKKKIRICSKEGNKDSERPRRYDLRDYSVFSLKKTEGCFIPLLWEGIERDLVISVFSGDSVWGNGLKLHHGMFRLDTRKKFFIEMMVKHWNKVPRKALTAPGLKVFNKELEKPCRYVVWVLACQQYLLFRVRSWTY